MPEVEKKEISQEIISEWYAEKGIEKEPVKESKEKEISKADQGFVLSAKKRDDEKREEENCKKLLVKKEIKNLIAIAEEGGLTKAIKEARKKNDPFLLDVFHDVIARDGAFRKFLSR